MKKLKNVIFMACLISARALAGFEVDSALEQVNNSAAFGLSLLNLDYKEFFFDSDNTSLNSVPLKSTESGNIFGFTLDTRATFWEMIYTNLYLDYYNGELKFDGTEVKKTTDRQRNPAENFLPLVAKFGHNFFNTDLKAGPVFTFSEDHVLQAIPYVGVGYRYWYRQYNVIGTKEKYQHYKVIAGIKLNWLLMKDLVLSPYVEGGRIFNAHMKFCGNREEAPALHGTKFDLGNRSIYTAGLELNYKVFDEFFLNGFVSYAQFKYGRSDSKNNFFEPGSKTKELKFGLGIRYSWLID